MDCKNAYLLHSIIFSLKCEEIARHVSENAEFAVSSIMHSVIHLLTAI